jgi:hypothetical protein
MTDPVDPRIQATALSFLRGDVGVLDFTYAFRGAVNEVTATRPLQGAEVDLFYELEVWETAGWDERPDVVDRLRAIARGMSDTG